MDPPCSKFERQYSVKGDGEIPIVKYKSTETGLTVFIAHVEGPIVKGYICLATEAHDDDGLPHTLEHLVFMGSENFPYKGVLDLLANRCLASGTNAWTDTDHTCYTMTTAGSEGFLTLLPVYLEHILYPTLTESAYITEVHHVNGKGENAGVVYCEMQARENTDESRCHLEMVRNMYPGHCGYNSETGGIMKNLRESTSHAKVCSYHKAFYRPDNLSVIITGHVESDEVFAALQPLEKKIVSKGPLPPFSRPWQSQVPRLEASVMKTVLYPSDNESHGMVKVAWRGPKEKDKYKFTSLCVLFDYLHDSPISPLQQDFVEDPYCSKVHCSMMENSECCIYISFQNVLKEKLSQIYPRLTDILNKLARGQEKIDMTRMCSVIHRKILERLSSVEDHPHDTVAHVLIGDFLFGENKEDLETRTSVISMLKDLKSKPEKFWVALINQYFINNPYVVIIGEPSKALMEEMGETEAERVALQQKDLGEDNLKKMGAILEKATEENEQEPPDAIIKDIAVPDVSQIHFHPISSYSSRRSDAANINPNFLLADIPFRFQLDDIHTNFVQISALLDSSGVPQELKYYLPLFCEVLFESPVVINDELISHEDIIHRLQADTFMTTASLGIQGETFSCGYISQVVQVLLKVELGKYEKGVAWLKDLLYNTKFTAERLKIVAKRLFNDIAEYKNRGYAVVRTLLKSIIFSKECNHAISSMLKQQTFLQKILQDLNKVPNLVESRMKWLLQALNCPSNLTIHMSADTARLAAVHPSPLRVWTDFIPKLRLLFSDKCTMNKTSEFVLPLESSPEKKVIVGVGSVESSYLVQAVPCIDSYSHPDYPAIMVFIQYLTQPEGPMWRQIRGLGLSYHYSMFVEPESGLLYFLLEKSTHIVSAFKEARDIVRGYVKGETNLSEITLESAKGSLTFKLIEKEETVSEVSKECLLSYFRGVSHTFNRDLLHKISKVSIADLQRVGEKYMAPLFDVSQIRCAVCCHPSKVEEISEEFRKLSIDLTILKSLEEDFLCRL